MKRLRIAIQSKGRLHDESTKFLRSLGLEFKRKKRSLMTTATNADVDIFFLRSNDIPEYVSGGVADFGITGENVVQEKFSKVKMLRKLGFAKCRLVIAVPEESQIKTVEDLEGERIATTYPNTLASFLQQYDIHAALIPIAGSVEVTPELKLADAICDITQTGNTLKAHNLIELQTILKSEAVLIESPFGNPLKSQFLSRL